MPDRQTFVLASVFAVLGFLLVVAAGAAGEARRAEAPRRAQLVRLIQERRAEVTGLSDDVNALRARVDDLERPTDAGDETGAAALALGAGSRAVRGTGFTVVLDDSDRRPPDAGEAGAYRVNDADLQLVANAVWAAGAEAVAVNGSRLVTTSPIRAAGDTLVVNFRPVSPPYRIDAVGADRERFLDSPIARRFDRWERQFGLRFDVGRARQLTVPAFAGRLQIRAARPADG